MAELETFGAVPSKVVHIPTCMRDPSGMSIAEYLPAVGRGGGQGHPLWKNVPGRLRRFFAQGFRYDAAKGVCILKNVPRSTENACAFALLEAVGIASRTDVGERGSGGLLALDQTIAGVSDACLLHHWHNTGACCGCGSRDHMVEACTRQNEGLPGIRALREKMVVAEDALRTAQAAAQDTESALHAAQDRARAGQDAVSDGSHVEVGRGRGATSRCGGASATVISRRIDPPRRAQATLTLQAALAAIWTASRIGESNALEEGARCIAYSPVEHVSWLASAVLSNASSKHGAIEIVFPFQSMDFARLSAMQLANVLAQSRWESLGFLWTRYMRVRRGNYMSSGATHRTP